MNSYYPVYEFHHDDFRIVGIFSREDDAKQFAAEGVNKRTVANVRPMTVIMDDLFTGRIASLGLELALRRAEQA